MVDSIPAGTPKPSGGDIPEPFNENDVRAWIGQFLKTLCREDKRCFHPSEFILNEEMQQSKAYDNPQEKEKALSDERHDYQTFARYCLDYLTKRDVLEIESVQDTSDNKEYAVYCKRPLLINAVCSKVDEIRGLADIDKILEERQWHRPQQ